MRSEKEITDLLIRLSRFQFDQSDEPAYSRHQYLIQDLLYALGQPSHVDKLVAIFNKHDAKKKQKDKRSP